MTFAGSSTRRAIIGRSARERGRSLSHCPAAAHHALQRFCIPRRHTMEETAHPPPEVESPTLVDLLPDDVLLRVFAAVSVADMGAWRSIGLVSWRWRRVGMHRELPIWSELNSQRFCAMWGHHAGSGGSAITCGTPAFASRHLSPIAARCTHLRKVDLSGIEIGGMLAGAAMPEMVELVRSCQRLDSFRARDKAPVDHVLVGSLLLSLSCSLSL